MFGLATGDALDSARRQIMGRLTGIAETVQRTAESAGATLSAIRDTHDAVMTMQKDLRGFIVEQRQFNSWMENRMANFDAVVAELRQVTDEWADRLETQEDVISQLREAVAQGDQKRAEELAAQSAQHSSVIAEVVARMRSAGTDSEQPVVTDPLPEVEQPLPDAGGDAVDGGGEQALPPNAEDESAADPDLGTVPEDGATEDSEPAPQDESTPRFE